MPRLRLFVVGYLLLVTAAAIILAAAILTGPYRAVERSDYMTYHVAARIVLAGHGACLYEVECQAAAQRELIGEEPSFERGALPYNSPPWLAALATPLGLLSLRVGFAIFTLIGLSVLTLGAWRLDPAAGAARILGPLLVLTAWPTVMAAIRGQSTLLVAGLLAISVSASRYRSGLGMGLAALKPTLAPLWAGWQLLGGHWRALGTAAMTLAVLVVISAIVVSPQALVDYPAHLLGVARVDALGVHPTEMIHWRGAAARLGTDGWLILVGSLLTLGMVGAVWLRTSSRDLGAAAAFLATPLVIPHANQHEAVLAMIGVLLAITVATELRARLVAGAIGLHAVLWLGPVLSAEASAWLLFFGQLGWLVAVAALAFRGISPLVGRNDEEASLHGEIAIK
jgi:alpha-1,2-mannosyltransferase